MRLYRLLERHGQLKKRMYPWFEAPAVGFPMKYDGWNWDPAIREWVEADVGEVEVEVQVPAYPKPDEPPRLAQPLDVLGWHWNGRVEVWEESPMPLKRVQQEMERPLAPVGPPPEADPVRVSGWQWSDPMQEWFECPLTRQETAEGKERVPRPRYAPRPELSWRVDGWVWSSVRKKWEESPMPSEWVEVEQERGPKPERPPDTGVPTKAKGWTWSIEFKLWVADTFETAKAIFTPPRSLPPNVDEEMVARLFPSEQDFISYCDKFMKAGMPPAERQRVSLILREEVRRLLRAKSAKMNESFWKSALGGLSPQLQDKIEVVGIYGVLFILTTITGLVIGNILSRLLTPDTDHFILVAPPNTYLLGPDNWMYSRHIGTSLGGRPFYSECEDIGTEYTRHKRARWSGEPDIIDFLGGFLETGFQFPYWVKYLWSYWLVEYIGVLESAGPNFHKLKKPIYDPAARLPIGWSAPVSEWCKDFHYYL